VVQVLAATGARTGWGADIAAAFSRRCPTGYLFTPSTPPRWLREGAASSAATYPSPSSRRTTLREDGNMPASEVSFDADIKPLFREKDRDSMRGAFDLWSYPDVQTHADAIAEHLRNGSMPCDGAWSPERVEVFERWVAQGKPE
jgi:hypothetical protein